ncbi:MAG: 1-deoxy-D-xylulose-5-phosphate reductoisomerase [Candidatus Omnitrophica bacterium]|nr:1-deoxy-D-xylulose-5-phosphate reductoisomerase [Candidatus Omnitrophota bacterium]
MMRRIAVFGSTGSIGVNTLKVASALKDKFEVVALSADSNIELLAGQARRFKAKVISVRDSKLAAKIKRMVKPGTRVLYGPDGLKEIASGSGVDMVVFAISGSSCLAPLVTAIRSKKMIALANKEALVSAGHLIMRLAEENGVCIVPIDSEHSAIFQCLEGKRPYLKKIYLTATGGPLLNIPKKRFDSLSTKFILNHPKWNMGRKISVDSATMMNKGLEIIEANRLFGVDENSIEVLIHPQALIHSMIELEDNTVFAEMSVPDMRIPIQYALTYPARLETMTRPLGFRDIKNLSFQKPDLGKFPCLSLARSALKRGGTYPAILNAADEEAVKKYLEGKIKFSRIPYIIEKVLARHKRINKKELSIDDILTAEAWAREEVEKFCL